MAPHTDVFFFFQCFDFFSDCEVQNLLHGVDATRLQFICQLNPDQILQIVTTHLEKKKKKSLCVVFLEAAPHTGLLFLELTERMAPKSSGCLSRSIAIVIKSKADIF